MAIHLTRLGTQLNPDESKTRRTFMLLYRHRVASCVFVKSLFVPTFALNLFHFRTTGRSFMAFTAASTAGSDRTLFWNRETSPGSVSFDPQTPIVKQANIISLSDVNDRGNDPLHNGALPDGATLLATGSTWEDFASLSTLHEANVLFVSHPTTSREVLARLLQEVPSLEWVHVRSAGIDFVTSPTLSAFKGSITNAKGTFSSTLAEYTMMACSFFAKDLPRLMRNKGNCEWDKYDVLELRGATLGIIGYGDIGRAAARLAVAYGMKVRAVRRRPEPDDLCDVVYGNDKDSLGKIFRECNYILCAAPLTKDTRGMIGKDEFDNAKAGTVFINVGRGAIVDEPEMIKALGDGRLKGAGLDVFATEPLPRESPLWTMDNVLLSPHNMDKTATFTTEATTFMVEENIPRFLRCLPLLNPVNAESGY